VFDLKIKKTYPTTTLLYYAMAD